MKRPSRQMSVIAFMQSQNFSNYVGSWRPMEDPEGAAKPSRTSRAGRRRYRAARPD